MAVNLRHPCTIPSNRHGSQLCSVVYQLFRRRPYEPNSILPRARKPPADGRAHHSHQLLRERPYAIPRREATRLRGRVDSAKAEELLAMLGFNVDEAAPSNLKGNGQRRGRRRKRPGGNTKAIRDAEWAPSAPAADKQVPPYMTLYIRPTAVEERGWGERPGLRRASRWTNRRLMARLHPL